MPKEKLSGILREVAELRRTMSWPVDTGGSAFSEDFETLLPRLSVKTELLPKTAKVISNNKRIWNKLINVTFRITIHHASWTPLFSLSNQKNNSNYGRKDAPDRFIQVHISVSDEWLEIVLKDDAPQFDPFIQAPRPNLDLDINERPIGGLGVHMVKKLMDDARADYDGNGNVIVLLKKLHQAARLPNRRRYNRVNSNSCKRQYSCHCQRQ